MTAIVFQWTDDGVMKPVGAQSVKAADAEFVVGQFYDLMPVEQASAKSRSHYFATINEAWKNLPEAAAAQFPTSEHLRKFCLVRCGYRDERSIVCASKAEAQRIAAFMKPMDEFAVVVVSEAVVTVYTAKSQSQKAMGRKEFGESKTAVLDYVANLIGVPADQIAAAARDAA